MADAAPDEDIADHGHRYKLTIEFDGTPFVGWQRQDNGLSVQEVLERAGSALCNGVATPVYGAGRTDAGVHARAMVAHIDLPKPFEPHTVMQALNAHARPHPIAVLSAEAVGQDFHARFTCTGRAYQYQVLSRKAAAGLWTNRAWRVPQALDLAAMAAATPALLGRHDFTTFRAAQCQADGPVKTLSRFDVSAQADGLVTFDLEAPSFLHNQVRSLVGSLVQVGLGRWQPSDLLEALKACDRARCGPVAPAHGLYFMRAYYGENLL